MALILCGTIAGQEFRGSVTGLVSDQQAAVVPGAKIVATQVETGAESHTISGSEGRFTLPFLAPGTYTVAAEAPGFKRYLRQGVRVNANEQTNIDIQLEIGQAAESVTVSAESPLLTTSTASTGQVINLRQVENMPMAGRTPLVLAQLSFGVIPNNDPRFYRPFDDGGPSGFSIGGAPNRSNELLLDGTPDSSVGNGMGFSPPVDATEEVKVESFQADASYGHSGGGTVNMVTKAGTNAFHGTAYDFNQVSALGATLFFTNRAGQKKNVSNYNQWGVTAGGPVIIPKVLDGHNRVFFFFAYEGINQKLPRATSTTTPTQAERNGDLSALLALGANYQVYDPATGVREGSRVRRQPFAGNIVPAARISPVAKNIFTYYGLPNQAGLADGRNNYYVGAVGEFNTFASELGRLDFNLSNRHKLFFNFRHNDRLLNNGTTFDNKATGSFLGQINWGATVDDVYTLTPTTVLNVRLNWLRNGERRGGFFDGFDITTLGLPANLKAQATRLNFPQINLGGFEGLGSSRGGGIINPYDNYQLFTSLSKTTGRHGIKAGADIRLIRQTNINFGQSSGTFTFGNDWARGPLDNSPAAPLGQELTALLLGLPTGGSWDINATESSQNMYLALFVQDDYRVRSNLTLNIGLRLEQELPTTERYNRSVNGFDAAAASPISAVAAAAYARNPISEIPPSQFRAVGGLLFASAQNRELFHTPSTAWSPRFGFAWTPAALGKTVLRGGMGIFVYPLNRAGTGIDQTGFSQSTPVVATLDGNLTPNATMSNPFPDGIQRPQGSALGAATFLGRGIGYFTGDVKNPYSVRWNFDVQRQLPHDAVMEVGYIYNHSVHQTLNRNIDFVPAQYLSTSPFRDQPVIDRLTANVTNPFEGLIPGTGLTGSTVARNQLLRPFPQFTGITERSIPEGRAIFHMLQARVEKRFSHGFQFLANYLFSKLIERRTRLNDPDPFPEKRIASEDRPQRFVFSMSWDLPFGKGRAIGHSAPAVVNRFISGWTTNAIYTVQPGPPLGWGNVIYLGGDLHLDPHNVDNTFDVTRFNRNSAQQLAQNLRTFPSQFATLRQDGVNSLDFSVLKNTYITERINLQFRCEFFNFLNHPSFNPPNLSPTATDFGRITSQANLARSTQLALRLVW
jgi:hypothetical protein